MSKPITIVAVEGGFTVSVSAERAKAYGAKRRKRPVNGNVAVGSDGAGLQIVPGLEPLIYDREGALSVAHQIGRYLLGFGDLVFAYTDAPKGFFDAGEGEP
jgi:hypothetical protein